MLSFGATAVSSANDSNSNSTSENDDDGGGGEENISSYSHYLDVVLHIFLMVLYVALNCKTNSSI
jgi:hypothetical protein